MARLELGIAAFGTAFSGRWVVGLLGLVGGVWICSWLRRKVAALRHKLATLLRGPSYGPR